MTGKEKLRKALRHEDAPILLDIGGFARNRIRSIVPGVSAENAVVLADAVKKYNE